MADIRYWQHEFIELYRSLARKMRAIFQHTFEKRKYSKIVAHNTRKDTEMKNINGKRSCSAYNFVWVHYYNYLLLTVSFTCTVSYMQHDYYQRTSYQCVTSYTGSLHIEL
jgi:hypothetical protein